MLARSSAVASFTFKDEACQSLSVTRKLSADPHCAAHGPTSSSAALRACCASCRVACGANLTNIAAAVQQLCYCHRMHFANPACNLTTAASCASLMPRLVAKHAGKQVPTSASFFLRLQRHTESWQLTGGLTDSLGPNPVFISSVVPKARQTNPSPHSLSQAEGTGGLLSALA